MLTILGLLAVLLVPLPSLTEGKKVKDFCFSKYEQPKKKTEEKVFNEVQVSLKGFQSLIVF